LAAESARYRPVSYRQAEPLIRLCTRSLDPDGIERLTDPLKVQVLAPLLDEAALGLDEQDGAYRLMERDFPPLAAKHRDVAYARARQRLLRGRLEGVETLLAGDVSAPGLALFGWLRFLQEDGGSALACFEAALTAIRRKTRKRIVYINLETAVGRPPGCVRRGARQGESGPVDPVNRRNRSNTRRTQSPGAI